MNPIAYMDENDLRQTAAFRRVFTQKQDNPTLGIMQLLIHAEQAVDSSPTIQRDLFGKATNFNLASEIKKNPELHASIDCVRYYLENKLGPNAPNLHLGFEFELPDKGLIKANALGYAEHLKEEYPELGERFEGYFTTHQSSKLYLENKQATANQPELQQSKSMDYYSKQSKQEWLGL